MNASASFTDSVVSALSQDAEILASMAEPQWDDHRKVLLIRVDPKDQDSARDLGERVVELIRGIKTEKFKAGLQQLNVEGKLVFVFKLTLEQE